MGSSNSVNTEKYRDLNIKNQAQQEKLVKIGDFRDFTFEDIQVYQDQNTNKNGNKNQDDQKLIAVKQNLVEDGKTFSLLAKEAQMRLTYSHNNILSLLGYKFTSSNEICGSTNICFLYYEYYEHNLDIEITRRHKRAEYFSESELWYLIDSIASAGDFFQQNGIYHGDIRPINVYLNQKGHTKLGDHGLVNSNKNGYVKTFMEIDNAYLSPILLQQIKQKQNETSDNCYKSDVFSLGITILEAATLISGQTLYDWDNFTIKNHFIKDFLNRVQSRYSQELLNVLTLMLEENEENRPDFTQLVNGENINNYNLSKNQNSSENLNQNYLLLAQKSQHQHNIPAPGYYYEFSPSKNTLESYRNTSMNQTIQTASPGRYNTNNQQQYSPSTQQQQKYSSQNQNQQIQIQNQNFQPILTFTPNNKSQQQQQQQKSFSPFLKTDNNNNQLQSYLKQDSPLEQQKYHIQNQYSTVQTNSIIQKQQQQYQSTASNIQQQQQQQSQQQQHSFNNNNDISSSPGQFKISQREYQDQTPIRTVQTEQQQQFDSSSIPTTPQQKQKQQQQQQISQQQQQQQQQILPRYQLNPQQAKYAYENNIIQKKITQPSQRYQLNDNRYNVY